MPALKPVRPATLFLIVLGATAIACQAQSALSVDQIVGRMQQARAEDRANKAGYTVTREYRLAPEGAPQPTSEVVAEISFFPPAEKQYAIVKSQGSARGASIVRRILDHEATMAAHWQLHDVSPANYDFALLGRENLYGRDCYVLQLSPKRDAAELVRGRAWVDRDNFQIRRIEGETAKSPSLWVKKLRLTIDYGVVNGVWLETSTQAVADVRLAGTHVLTSRELDVRRATLDARAAKPHQSRQSTGSIAADTAAWVAR